MQTTTSRLTSGTQTVNRDVATALTKEPSSYSLAVLFGLGVKNSNPLRPGHVYEGTADPARVAKRRAKNRVARKSRRINRKRGA